jgi:hypothetical protein
MKHDYAPQAKQHTAQSGLTPITAIMFTALMFNCIGMLSVVYLAVNETPSPHLLFGGLAFWIGIMVSGLWLRNRKVAF